MNIIKTRRRSLARKLVSGAALTAVVLGSAAPAFAWKPKTHVYLAEEAVRDALDGKVTIFETDYATGKIVGKLGDFDVDPKILAAIKAAPRQFRAGVLGPDAYPDIMTGQMITHPDAAFPVDGAAGGSNAWLTHIWNTGFAGSSDPKVNAFAIGYLTHAAGDVFAHTYVNHFSGGEFELLPDPTNASKHLIIEGYIGKRTPTTISAFTSTIAVGTPCNQRKREDLGLDPGGECGAKPVTTTPIISGEDASIDGVERFIYDAMIAAPPGSVLDTKLFKGGGVDKSIPSIFSRLRNGLAGKVAEYEARLAKMGPVEALAYKATGGPVAAYQREWIKDIDDGLVAWPKTSQEIAKALVYNEAGADLPRAKAAMDAYTRAHLASMAGTPDVLVLAVGVISDILNAILPPPVREALNEITKAPLNFIVWAATGMTPEAWAESLTSPEKVFDKIVNRGGGGNNGDQPHPVTLADFNRDQLKIADAGYANPSLKWKIEDLPPAFDTLQLTKMLFLGETGMRQLQAALKAKGVETGPTPSPYQNAMLGWVRSLDHGNQWQGLATPQRAGTSPQPFFAQRNGAAWRKLFLPVLGEKPWSGSGGSAPAPIPAPGDLKDKIGAILNPPGGSGSTPAPAPAPGVPAPWPGERGPIETIPAPAPAPKRASIADIVGGWTSPGGELQIKAGGDGGFAEITAPGASAPGYMATITADANGRSFTADWRTLGGGRSGRLSLTPSSDGATLSVAKLSGDALGPASYAATRTAAKAPDPVPRPAPVEGGGGSGGVVPPGRGGPVPGTPIGGGGGSVGGGGGFQSISKHFDVRFDGAKPFRDSELHVYVTVKNVTDIDRPITPGNFIPNLTNQDGETITSRELYRATGEPATSFRPVIQAGAEVKVRFIFRPDAKTAQPKTFSIEVYENRKFNFDVSNVRLGSLAP